MDSSVVATVADSDVIASVDVTSSMSPDVVTSSSQPRSACTNKCTTMTLEEVVNSSKNVHLNQIYNSDVKHIYYMYM